MFKLLLIFLAAGVGGVSRYALTTWIQSATASPFPFGTIAVNLIGCLAIGFLAASVEESLHMKEEYRIALVVGFLGGFTTFSAFARETATLIEQRELLLAGANILLSNGLGVAAVICGILLGRRILGGG